MFPELPEDEDAVTSSAGPSLHWYILLQLNLEQASMSMDVGMLQQILNVKLHIGKCLSRSSEEETLSTQASSGDFTQTTVQEIDTLVKEDDNTEDEAESLR